MKKKSFCIGLIIALSLAFLGCNGGNKLPKQIDALQAQLQELEEKSNELKNDNADLNKELERIQNENRLLKGRFINFEKARGYGILDKESIERISYFLTGSVIEVIDFKDDLWQEEINLPAEKWTTLKKTDSIPGLVKPIMDSVLEKDIKTSFFLQHPELFKVAGSDIFIGGPDDIKIDYLGKYGYAYAMTLSSELWRDEAVTTPYCIGNIVFIDGLPSNLLFFNF